MTFPKLRVPELLGDYDNNDIDRPWQTQTPKSNPETVLLTDCL